MSARDALFRHLTGTSLCPPPRPADEATGLLDAYRAEVLREAGGVADELIAGIDRTGDDDAFVKADAYRAYSDRLHEIADSDPAGKDTGGATQAPAGESTRPAPDPMPAIRVAIEDFDFAGYGLDDVDPTSEYAVWVGDLASAIAGALPDSEPTRPPAGAEVRFTDRNGDEWVSCSDPHCRNAERYAKATERDWQHDHTGAWRCPRHRTSPTYAFTRGEPGGDA